MNQKKFKVGANFLQALKAYRQVSVLAQKAMEEGKSGKEQAEGSQGTERLRALGARLYPARQRVVLAQIETQRPDCKTFWFEPDKAHGQKELASFVPGQHMSLCAQVNGVPVSRPYTLISSPEQARQGRYGFTIKAQGLLSGYMVEEAKVGESFLLTGPGGDFTWQPLRDASHLVALASGSGVAAFLSMARAIREGSLPLRLTLLYSCAWQEGFLHQKELDALVGSGVEVEYFCPDCPDGSLAPLGEKAVEKAAGGKAYSLFWCGSPEAAASFRALASKLSTKPQSLRGGENGVLCAPSQGPTYRLRIKARTITYTVEARRGETLLTALERAGISAPVRCRGGKCGFCRSRWVSGRYQVLPGFEGRLEGEKEAGWLHPCCTVPLSDMEFEIYPL